MASIRSIRSSSERTSSRYTLWKPGPSFLSAIRCSNKPRAARMQSVMALRSAATVKFDSDCVRRHSVYIGSAFPRLPRRFAPRNDKSGGIVRSAKPLYNLPARKALTERRYRRNRFSRFYRQPVRIGSIAPGPAVPSPTTLRWQPCKLSTIHFPFAARRVPLQSLIRLHIAELARRAAGILAERIGEGR